jgi:thiol-disulfide isomerase/thioredoxin
MAVEVSSDELINGQIGNHAKVVVKYYADWCGSCKLFSPKYKRLSADERFLGITFLDIDAEHNPEARKMSGVDTLPFFATFRNGKLLSAKSTAKEESLVEMLNEL